MFSECSRRIRKFPKTFLRPTSPACYGGAATSSRARGAGWGWDDAPRPATLCRTNFETSQRGRDRNINGKGAKRRRAASEKPSCKHCERRRVAVRSGSPYSPVHGAFMGNGGSSDPASVSVAREGDRNIRTRISVTQSGKRARADQSGSEDEEIVDGARTGSSFSGAYSISPRIIRTPASPQARVRPPYLDLSGTHENYGRVSPCSADEPGSDDSRAGSNNRSLPPVFDDLVSGVRILWDLSCQFWGLRYSTNARVHVQNLPSRFLEGPEVPCAPTFHSHVLLGEPERPDDDGKSEDEEMEVEEALISSSSSDDETLCDSCEESLDIESEKYQGPGSHYSFPGQTRPNLDDKFPNLAASPLSPGIHHAIIVRGAHEAGSPREYGQSPTRAGAQGLGLDGDLPISPEIPDDETLLSRYSFPHWRYYRFEGVREGHANGSTRAERKVPVRYCDEANIEAQGVKAEPDADARRVQWENAGLYDF